jgi:dimethylhistidine N-methyltransferase
MSVTTADFAPTLVDLSEFQADVVQGLNQVNRSIPSKYFYDAAGSALFDRICELDEYYPTRTEASIMQQHAAQMADVLGPEVRLVEFGSGSSTKTRMLLDHLIDPVTYVPVDISAEHLLRTAADLSEEYPLLNVKPLIADFTQPIELPPAELGTSKTCVYFPGSTIGNFQPSAAQDLLRVIARTTDTDGGLLIGFDLQKDPSVIEAAYNDRLGVTASFNKNLLERINRELDGDFETDQFDHLAFYNDVAGRIEMHLVSLQPQCVQVGISRFHFRWGETILTEYSHKYTVNGFADMAASCGWRCHRVWTDDRKYFAVMYLQHEGMEG